MESITLTQCLPQVFASRTDMVSDVWMQDLTMERGKTYLIEAQSGTGKSSLCSYIIGYRHDYQGMIAFDGRDTRTLKRNDWTLLRQRSLSHLFQELRLFPELTAMENVMIKNNLTGFKKKKEIKAWFERLDIADKQDTPVAIMSFGQQQRVALMRSLCQPFHFLLADEPVSHLDDLNSDIVGQMMVEECRKQGAGLIVTSIGRHPVIDYDKTLRL